MKILEFLDSLKWIDGSPLKHHIEPYRRRLFEQKHATDARGRPRHNLILTGRAKKNWKSVDLVLDGLYCLLTDSPGGNQCYLLANDEGQADDDLTIAKKLVQANPALKKHLVIRKKVIERRDGQGFLMILPAKDIAGTHGKTFRYVGLDEIHEYRTWDILEAMQLDPTRLDAQMFITSYASIYHRPGVPLFDLMQRGRAGTDPKMLFSWYAADYCTDPDFEHCDPETRANPSRGSWAGQNYLDQQRSRLPAHKFRRLHLNLPGLPEGSAYQPEPIMEAIPRGVRVRPPEPGRTYRFFVDMSGGSLDDAALAVGYRDADGRMVLARIVDQGQPPPFDPRRAVKRFAAVVKEYGGSAVEGDHYAGETFASDFQNDHRIMYRVCEHPKSQLYEALEPHLNGYQLVLLDEPKLEQQLLGLVWRGQKIDHGPGEHDDYANAVAGLVHVLAEPVLTMADLPQGVGLRDMAGLVPGVPWEAMTDRPDAAFGSMGTLPDLIERRRLFDW